MRFRIGGGETIGAGNRLLADERFDYAYDAEGNLVQKTDRASGELASYAYDHRNRLVGIETKSADGTVLLRIGYVYDVFERRIAETIDGDGSGPIAATSTRYVYDGANVWADYDESGSVSARYLFADGEDALLARWRAGDGAAWYLVDHLGTVCDVVDASGQVVNHVEYDSFDRDPPEAPTPCRLGEAAAGTMGGSSPRPRTCTTDGPDRRGDNVV